MQFHIRDDDFIPGSDSVIFNEFFKILDKLPSDATVIWHHFSFDIDTLWRFLNRPIRAFASICARKLTSLKFIKVFLFVKNFIF